MADIVTGTVSGQVDMTGVLNNFSDMRREAAMDANTTNTETMKGFDRINADVLMSAGQVRTESAAHAAEIVKEGLKGDYVTQKSISEAERAASTQIDMMEDVMISQFTQIGRDTADLRAQVTHTLYAVGVNADRTSKDAQIAVLQNTIEGQKNTAYLSDRITNDGEKTRLLMAGLSNDDLNRRLIERNAMIVEGRGDHRFYGLSNQINALQSQFQAAAQKTVNFGTMGANTQASTNNVA